MFFTILAGSAALFLVTSYTLYTVYQIAKYAVREFGPLMLIIGSALGIGYVLHLIDKHTYLKLSYTAAPTFLMFTWAVVFHIQPGRIVAFLNLRVVPVLKKITYEFARPPIWFELAALATSVWYWATPMGLHTELQWAALALATGPVGYLIKSGRYFKRK